MSDIAPLTCFLKAVAGAFVGFFCFVFGFLGYLVSYGSYSSFVHASSKGTAIFPRFRDWVLPYNPKAYWDRRAKDFLKEGGLRELPGSSRKILYDSLLDALNRVSFSSLLEVGCGFGTNLKLVSDSFSGKRLFGIDLSGEMVSAARHYLKPYPKIGLERQNLAETGFGDESFDLVFSCETLLHVPKSEIRKTVKELVRLSKRYVVLIEPELSRIPFFQRLFHAKHVFFHNYQNLFRKTGKTELFYICSIPYQFRAVYIFKKLKG